jgi:cell division protein ZapE
VLGTDQGDYRTELDAAAEPSFFVRGQAGCPAQKLDRCFHQLTGGAAAEEAAPIGAGRELRLLAGGGVARASFGCLCDAALGAGDYVALAQRYHTLCVDELPQMSLQRKDQVSGARLGGCGALGIVWMLALSRLAASGQSLMSP